MRCEKRPHVGLDPFGGILRRAAAWEWAACATERSSRAIASIIRGAFGPPPHSRARPAPSEQETPRARPTYTKGGARSSAAGRFEQAVSQAQILRNSARNRSACNANSRTPSRATWYVAFSRPYPAAARYRSRARYGAPGQSLDIRRLHAPTAAVRRHSRMPTTIKTKYRPNSSAVRCNPR